jgi:hypothetical protein
MAAATSLPLLSALKASAWGPGLNSNPSTFVLTLAKLVTCHKFFPIPSDWVIITPPAF